MMSRLVLGQISSAHARGHADQPGGANPPPHASPLMLPDS
jgi:hypothetical protein